MTTDTSRDTSASVDEAVDLARGAARELADTDLVTRASFLLAVASAVDAERGRLVAIAHEETGIPVDRLAGEVARTTGQLRMFADVVREGSWLEAMIDHARVGASPARPDLRRMLVPLGPVAVFGASNFPFAFSVVGGDTASALAAGCPVVVKAHSGHPRLSAETTAIAVDALASSGAPNGILGTVYGQAEGRALITHPSVRAGAFTGSTYAGRLLFDLASGREAPIPFYGELGSVNPVVVGPVRSLSRAEELADGLLGSLALSQGQLCTKPGVVMVPSGTGLPELIASRFELGGDRLLTSSVSRAYDRGIEAIGAIHGVRTLVAGATSPVGPASPPTIFLTDIATALGAPGILLEECFGPTTILIEYTSPDEVLAVLETISGALTATFHLEPDDLEAFGPAIATARERVGRIVFDGWPTGVAVTWSQHHGGPWPATTSALFTSVGATSIRRFLRPVLYQDAPASVLSPALRDGNPWNVPVRVDGIARR